MTTIPFWQRMSTPTTEPLEALEGGSTLFYLDETTGIATAFWRCGERHDGYHFHAAILSSDDYMVIETDTAERLLQAIPIDITRMRIVDDNQLRAMRVKYMHDHAMPEFDARATCAVISLLIYAGQRG